MYTCIYLSIYLFVCWSVYLPIYLSAYMYHEWYMVFTFDSGFSGVQTPGLQPSCPVTRMLPWAIWIKTPSTFLCGQFWLKGLCVVSSCPTWKIPSFSVSPETTSCVRPRDGVGERDQISMPQTWIMSWKKWAKTMENHDNHHKHP